MNCTVTRQPFPTLEGLTMEWLSRTDTVMLVVTAYLAIMTLVRLMRQREERLVADVQRQIEARRHEKKREPNKTRKAA